MNKRTTRSLELDEPIITGNTKAAVKAAGGGSADLWTVPPDQIHHDPRDNVRPLDPERVRHVANLIKANGYDRKKPLGCFVRKVDGEDRIFVYEGQHRYHAALLAIKEGMPPGKEIDRLPIVIDEAKSVNRVNLIFAGIVNNDGEKLTPLELAEKIVELQQLDVDNDTICARLNITDQTVRDVLLLANAPTALHQLVRSNRRHSPSRRSARTGLRERLSVCRTLRRRRTPVILRQFRYACSGGSHYSKGVSLSHGAAAPRRKLCF